MPPPMSALITAKDNNDDLVEVVLFEKFNDLRGFGRRLFLPFDVRFIFDRIFGKCFSSNSFNTVQLLST